MSPKQSNQTNGWSFISLHFLPIASQRYPVTVRRNHPNREQKSGQFNSIPANTVANTAPAGGGSVPLTCPVAHQSTPSVVPQPISAPEGPLPENRLSAPERVILRDNWHKLMAFEGLFVEVFFERLLHEAPELIERFGDAIDLVPRYLTEWFAGCIRALHPPTPSVSHSVTRAGAEDDSDIAVTSAALLADLGMRAEHWQKARRIWLWMMGQLPNLDEYDRENLAKGVDSAAYRFFTFHILPTAEAAIDRYEGALLPDIRAEIGRAWDKMKAEQVFIRGNIRQMIAHYPPDLLAGIDHLGVEKIGEAVGQLVELLVKSPEESTQIYAAAREISRQHLSLGVLPNVYLALVEPMAKVMQTYVLSPTPSFEQACRLVLNRASRLLQQPALARQQLRQEAAEFIDQLAQELNWSTADHRQRWLAIEAEINATGTYTQTPDELNYGAQLAWRNASKCIGRIGWRNLMVRDLRHITDPDAMFRECVEHLRLATNGGAMQSIINVFRPQKPGERWGPRIWNSQYIRFAAYKQPDGTLLGDPANRPLTRAIERLGWAPPATKTPFDPLPLVIEVPGQAPKLYHFEADDVLMVPIHHPQYPAVEGLGLRWCAIPAIANFRLEIGGIRYGCAPFNGWFMETEIARNLWEEGRYGKAEAIAQAMGLDTSSEQTLWRDRAFLELNVAVLHSFSRAKVTLVDHQTAARQFLSHDLREKRAGRECPAQWSWVVPSAGGSTTAVWHHEMRDFYLTPSYQHAPDKWAVLAGEVEIRGEKSQPEASPAPHRMVILYGSETGTAERFAYQTARRLARHHPRVMALDEYNTNELSREPLVLILTSTFADGDLPGNAQQFYAWIRKQPDGAAQGVNYAVMALGSTVYPSFCAAGIALNHQLKRLGANEIVAMHQGDEIRNQVRTFQHWLNQVATWLGESLAVDKTLFRNDAAWRVSLLTANPVNLMPTPAKVGQHPGMAVPVLANRELLKAVTPNSRSTRFMAFDLSGTGLTYETGDHVAIYPHNPPALVQRLCDQLNLDPEAWFIAERVDDTATQRDVVIGPSSLQGALAEEVDLTLREPFDDLIGLLAQLASVPTEGQQLAEWVTTLANEAEEETAQKLKKMIADRYLTVPDLLDAFPSAQPTLAQLLELLPRQRPRLYSISSCSLVYPQQIHLTIGVEQATTDAGRIREGLCSNYLASRQPEQGDLVRLAVRKSAFRPPNNPSAPVIMVGAGTGLSPLIGFLQYREVQQRALGTAKLGESWLYFGCRDQNDFLYQSQLESWHQSGVLTHLDVAFSRVNEQPVYVQHLIQAQQAQLWAVLMQPDCHVYICGAPGMAAAVVEVLLEMGQAVGGLTYADAIRFFWTMQRQNRLVMDIWGTLPNPRPSLNNLFSSHFGTEALAN